MRGREQRHYLQESLRWESRPTAMVMLGDRDTCDSQGVREMKTKVAPLAGFMSPFPVLQELGGRITYATRVQLQNPS